MAQKGFEILSNSADIRLRVWGKTLQELFRAALQGMASCIKPAVSTFKKKDLKEKQEVAIEAVDLTSLLIEFLSAVLAHAEDAGAVFVDVSFKDFGENFLKGKLTGVKTEEGVKQEIKAVSYEDVDIQKNPETGMYETILIFEV